MNGYMERGGSHDHVTIPPDSGPPGRHRRMATRRDKRDPLREDIRLAGANPGGHHPGAGGQRRFRPGRAHPPHGDSLPPRSPGPGSGRPGEDHSRPGSRSRDQRRTCFQLLPPAGQRGRGSPQGSNGRGGSSASGQKSAGKSAGRHAGARPGTDTRRAHTDRQAGVVLRARPGRAGADRPPDRGATKERPRPPPRDRRPVESRRSSTRPRCGARSSSCGRPASFVWPSRRSPTRSRPDWPTSSRRSSAPSPGFTPISRITSANGYTSRRSCGWRAGSGATETATRT